MKKFQIGQLYFGFILEKKQNITDVNSVAHLFKHQRSGARLLYLQNTDDNKVFFISFKTPPEDNCGTPHILEHSVLCGSKKYQSKDPFNELAKGSLNTYLNALTYADKTMYPVASRNHKDFMNMMDVYLNAVFYPNIYDKKEIFMQEGWHYELNEKKDELSVSGVVFNEMKGVFSDPEAMLDSYISESLFPTSIYRFESGGTPEAIPELTYEKFLDFHKKYYHPSNSFLYLYGDMDIEEQLQWIDREYLSNFEEVNINSDIKEEQNFSTPVDFDETYPISVGETTENKTFLSYNVRLGKCTDPELTLALDILNEILLGNNASPLKNVLLESGFIADVDGWLDSSKLDMVYSIVGKKSEKNRLEDFCAKIETTLQEIVEKGLDKRLIEAALNKWEFLLREENYGYRPKGLVYGMKLMKSWLHNVEPFFALMHWEHFNQIKKSWQNGYFENIIQTLILQNPNKAFGAVSPEVGKQTKINRDFYKKLQEKLKGMSIEAKETILQENQKLGNFQLQIDSEEVRNQIPILELHEIDKKADWVSTNYTEQGGLKTCFTPLDTNGIVYTQLFFNIRYVPQEMLPYVGLLSKLLGKLDTEKYSYDQLPTEMNIHTGGIYVTSDIYSSSKNEYVSFFTVNGKVLSEKLEEFFSLVEEILFKTSFDQKETLKKLIKTLKVKEESYLLNNAHLAAITRCNSSLFTASKVKDEVSVIHYYHFLSNIERELETNMEDLIHKLKETWNYLLHRNGFMAAIACNEKELPECKRYVKRLFEKMPQTNLNEQEYHYDMNHRKIAFKSTSKVQYNIQSENYMDYGFTYSGKMQVLKTIIDLEYLWNKVRVQGGAYGCGSNFLKNGNFYMYSYRDPDLKNTYEVYDQLKDFLRKLQLDGKQMRQYIIGTINILDRPKSNAEKFDLSLARHFMNITKEDIQKERDEILSATEEELKIYISLFEKLGKNYCTVGNEDMIEGQKEMFDEITFLL